VRQRSGRAIGTFWDWSDSRRWVERGPGGAKVAAGTVLEIALPFSDLHLKAGDPLAFFVAVYDADDGEVERHPANVPIDTEVPDAQFEMRHWSV
jgi:hypothetical protein